MGAERARISAFGCGLGTRKENSALIKTAVNRPRSVVFAAVHNKRLSPWDMPSAMPMIADIKGAINMAPMMMATLFSKRPNVAIKAERLIITKKSELWRVTLRISRMIPARSLSVREGKKVSNARQVRGQRDCSLSLRRFTMTVVPGFFRATAWGTLPKSKRSKRLSCVAPIKVRSQPVSASFRMPGTMPADDTTFG